MTTQMQIHQVLAAVSKAAGGDRWVVGGSTGLSLRGLPLPASPRDIDLYCDEEDGADIHHRLSDFSVDAQAFSESDIYRSTLSHYLIGGWRVELVAGFEVSAFGCRYVTEVARLLTPFGNRLPIEGDHRITLVPLAHELWFNALRGRADRVKIIAEGMRPHWKSHLAELETIESRNGFPAELVNQVRGWIINGEAGEAAWTLKLSSTLPAK